jgi:hypothetical protein
MEVGDPNDLEVEVELLSSDAVNVTMGADVSIEQWARKRPSFWKVTLEEPSRFLEDLGAGRRRTARQSACELCQSPEQCSRRSLPRGGAYHQVVPGRCGFGSPLLRCFVATKTG